MIINFARRAFQSRALRKISPYILAASAYFGGVYTPEYGRRIYDSLFYSNVPSSERSFKDPAGLTIEVRVNDTGEKEAYLCHGASGEERIIRKDLTVKTREFEQRETEDLNMPSALKLLNDG